MTAEEELAEMRSQYRYATLEGHVLVAGVLRLRCLRCKTRPVPAGWSFVALCGECLEAPGGTHQ
jgi:hypothetical protein